MSEIRLEGLSKNYKTVEALKDVSLSFDGNKIYGLLGRNGAGKSTMINIITNRIFPTSGNVLIDGEKAIENENAQSKIFCMSEKSNYMPNLKVKQAFDYAKYFYPKFDLNYANALADKFSLDTNRRIQSLSTGYNTIVKIILTLASNAEILILDEPTLGLDATVRSIFYKELVKYYADNPKVIILSTHLIEEVADLLEHVIIIDDGKILVDEDLDTVLESAYLVAGNQKNIDKYILDKEVINTDSIGTYKTATISGKPNKEELKNLGLEVTKPKLQEIFVDMTRREIEK